MRCSSAEALFEDIFIDKDAPAMLENEKESNDNIQEELKTFQEKYLINPLNNLDTSSIPRNSEIP